MKRSQLQAMLWPLGFVLTLFACGDSGGEGVMEARRIVQVPPYRVKPDTTAAERFGFVPQTPDIPFEWDVPEGWEQIASTQYRQLNFRVAGRTDTECYMSVLPGGGAVVDNVNRWRSQMSLPPITEDEVAALPTRPLIRMPATYVELDGTYVGMSGTENRSDHKMVGLILDVAGSGLFMKMFGPIEVMNEEVARFHQLCDSLRFKGTSQEPKEPETYGLTWEVPTHWVKDVPRPFRVATFRPQGSTALECYVSVLEGDGGGLMDNISRWCEQMSRPPLSEEEISNLPTYEVLGRESLLVELDGTFTPMSGGSNPDFKMLGMVCFLPDKCVFVKMTGPKDLVQAEREHFFDFCASLEM